MQQYFFVDLRCSMAYALVLRIRSLAGSKQKEKLFYIISGLSVCDNVVVFDFNDTSILITYCGIKATHVLFSNVYLFIVYLVRNTYL